MESEPVLSAKWTLQLPINNNPIGGLELVLSIERQLKLIPVLFSNSNIKFCLLSVSLKESFKKFLTIIISS